METEIRLAHEEDIENIHRLQAACLNEVWSERQLRETLDNGLYRIYAAFCEGETAGCMTVMSVGGEVSLDQLAVAEKFRRRGIGRKLLKRLIEDHRGSEGIYLEVRESNLPARRLYESAGFRETGRRRNFYEDPREDAVLMSYCKNG